MITVLIAYLVGGLVFTTVVLLGLRKTHTTSDMTVSLWMVFVMLWPVVAIAGVIEEWNDE